MDPVFVRGRGEQARFSDMNREETALGVDSLFRLMGTGEDNDRCAQKRNEQPGDANHKSASGVMVKNSRQGKYGLSFKTLSLKCRTLGSCRCLAAHDGGPVRS